MGRIDTEYGDVHVTCGSRNEAQLIADALVADRLAACVQLHEVESVFRWEGAVERDTEMLVVAKTRLDRFDRIVERIGRLHSYDLPAITCEPVVASEPTAAWIDQELGDDVGDR